MRLLLIKHKINTFVLGEQQLKIGCEQNSRQWLRCSVDSLSFLSFVGGLVAFELEASKKRKRKKKPW
jgi:hypothetical protein